MITNTDIFDYLDQCCRPAENLLEIGGGASTKALAKLFKHVTVIEHDPEYLNLVEGVEYIHAPLVPYSDPYFRDATLWYDRSVLEGRLGNYDAIIIDGPKGNQGRGGFFTNIDLFCGDILVFDDTHRMWEFRLAGRVAEHFNTNFETYTNGNRWFSVVKPGKAPEWRRFNYGRDV